MAEPRELGRDVHGYPTEGQFLQENREFRQTANSSRIIGRLGASLIGTVEFFKIVANRFGSARVQLPRSMLIAAEVSRGVPSHVVAASHSTHRF
jgi:hypothetical protein